MSNELQGKNYRAVRRLSNAADETLAEIGATCEHVPPASLAWLLRDGLIVPVTPPKTPAPAKSEAL